VRAAINLAVKTAGRFESYLSLVRGFLGLRGLGIIATGLDRLTGQSRYVFVMIFIRRLQSTGMTHQRINIHLNQFVRLT
jgi:hypothetical protein